MRKMIPIVLALAAAQMFGVAAQAQTLKTVQGSDGTADIARLWVLHARA